VPRPRPGLAIMAFKVGRGEEAPRSHAYEPAALLPAPSRSAIRLGASRAAAGRGPTHRLGRSSPDRTGRRIYSYVRSPVCSLRV
jgi:hypothetical protein